MGRMTSHILWKIKAMFETTNQATDKKTSWGFPGAPVFGRPARSQWLQTTYHLSISIVMFMYCLLTVTVKAIRSLHIL
jgi:hypothetical protein